MERWITDREIPHNLVMSLDAPAEHRPCQGELCNGQVKPLSKFAKAGRKADDTQAYRPRCRVCQAARARTEYATNPSQRAYCQYKTWFGRQHRRALLRSLKESQPCAVCGDFLPHYVMDFDHRDPSTKVECVSRIGSLKKALAEIAKCDLLCVDCHRGRHQREIRPDGDQPRDSLPVREAVQLRKLETPCTDCRSSFHYALMDFDHRDPSTKEWNLANIHGTSMTVAEAEMAKCDIVCARCHRIRTQKQNPRKPDREKPVRVKKPSQFGHLYDQVRAEYAAGATKEGLAKKHGMSRGNVRHLLNDPKPAPQPKLTDAQRVEFDRAAAAGTPTRELARRFEISRATVDRLAGR